jgi:hypothetical protein
MKKSPFYLELYFRDSGGGRPDCTPIYLPVSYAWQEDANDLHIQLDTKEGRDHLNVCPEEHKKSGDYILPVNKWLLRHLDFDPQIIPNYRWNGDTKADGALVYHFGWTSDARFADGVIAPRKYTELVESYWCSPNR